MVIFGKMSDLQKQFEKNNELDVVFNYLNHAITSNNQINKRIHSMNRNQYEKIEITKDIFAIEQSYDTRKSDKLLFESHIKYVDFQFMVSGEEIIKVAHTDLLEVDSEYSEEGDYSLYKTAPSSKIIILKGDLSIFFPRNGHMLGIQNSKNPERAFKVVVKVPLAII